MKKRLAFFLILAALFSPVILTADDSPQSIEEQLLTGFTASTINTAVVNVRENPGTDSRLIAKLKKGQKITVIERTGNVLFVDRYLGAWLKIRLSNGKEGYILSSFVSDPANKIEHFHIFFARFRNAWINKRMNDISEHVIFPLRYIQSFEGEEESLELQKSEFFKKTSIREPYMYKMTFERGEDNSILVSYGYEAQQYTLFFIISGGKWTLVKIKISSC